MARPRCLFLLCLALAACSSDRDLTHGADGSREWDRKLRAAVAVGTSVDDVARLMQQSGFVCEGLSPDSPKLTCTKSGGRTPVATRRWQAAFDIKDGRVAEIHSETSLDR